MSEDWTNPWNPDGDLGSNWDQNTAESLKTSAIDRLDVGGLPKPIQLKLEPPPFGVDQGNRVSWCWAAAIESWMKSFSNDNVNATTNMEGIWYRFQHLCYDDGSLIPTKDNWQEVTSTYGCNRWYYFSPPHNLLDLNFIMVILQQNIDKRGPGYILVAENESGSSYKHAYVVYGVDQIQIKGFSCWWIQNPDGIVRTCVPIARSPRWTLKDYKKYKWDVGSKSDYWLAWREN